MAYDLRTSGANYAVPMARAGKLTPEVMLTRINVATTLSGNTVTGASDKITVMSIPQGHWVHYIGLNVISGSVSGSAIVSANGVNWVSGATLYATGHKFIEGLISGAGAASQGGAYAGSFFTSASAVDVFFWINSGGTSGVGIFDVYAYVVPLQTGH